MHFESFFETYCHGFKKKFPQFCEAFNLKEVHSKNVSMEALSLGKNAGLEKEDLQLCRLTGLFHDMGRFPQFAQFMTFNDLVSCDHGKKSAIEAVRTKLIYEIEMEKRDIFLFSLFFHNKKQIPDLKKTRKNNLKLLYLRILKDADKLDIYRVVCESYTGTNKNSDIIAMNLRDSDQISPKIISDILSNRPASTEDVKSLTDLKLAQASWVFDMNFKHSLEEVKKRKYIQTLFSTIPASEGSKRCKNHIFSLINSD